MCKAFKHHYQMVMVLALAIGVLSIGIAPNVHALPLLKLTSGTDSISIDDNEASDIDLRDGIVSWNGGLGNFGITITSGITKPAIGSEDDPILDIISFDATYLGTGGGTLDVWFTETGFTLPSTAFMSSIGGTTDGTVSYETLLDGTTLASLGPYMPTPPDRSFSGDLQTSVSGLTDNPYSLGMHVAVTHTGANQSSSFDASLTPIPDASAVFLLASACLFGGLSGFRRKFNK